MTIIRIDVPPQGYEVAVGPLAGGIDRIRDIARKSKPILVSEPRVFGLHGHAFAEALQADPILVAEGAAAKDWQQLHELLAAMARLGPTRNTPIVALGGGSVGDVAGLAAALFKRGCPVVHVPTTLLAQADSAVGGKTAIDAFGEKNLIGTFHEPAFVIADPSLLDTLDERQLRAGYAEVIKYGLIDDPAFFAWCEANGRGILAGHPDLRRQAIVTSIQSKARLIGGDIEDRSGKRALLNLGHGFGHAIEAETGLGKVLHGEAVALGLSLAFRFSAELGICPKADVERVTAHIAACGLPIRLAEVGLAGRAAGLIKRMAGDKKNMDGRLALVLARGIGKAFLEPNIDARRLSDFLDRSG
ncbi:MAG TPA: 3-dehydroquinate synthase family protein [Sphingomicrobium sp.]|nr:3-dehydroquinate synthase family protein [Sphingomicrobium sp.]